jgi:hypothetical protein
MVQFVGKLANYNSQCKHIIRSVDLVRLFRKASWRKIQKGSADFGELFGFVYSQTEVSQCIITLFHENIFHFYVHMQDFVSLKCFVTLSTVMYELFDPFFIHWYFS